MNKHISYKLLPLLVLFLLLSFSTHAGVPALSYNNSPVVWDTTESIHYMVDAGTLGQLDQAAAFELIQEGLETWESLEGTNITFTFDGFVSDDIINDLYSSYSSFPLSYESAPYDLLFVYDNEGSILESLGESITTTAGVAFTSTLTYFSSQIGGAIIVLNGLKYDGNESMPGDISLNEMKGVIVHEIGHTLGLNHSNINYYFSSFIDDYNSYLATLYPYVFDEEATLHPDDMATVKWMYGADTPVLSGQITDSAGTPQAYLMVVARKVDSPFCRSYMALTGWPNSSESGAFEIPVLENGDYILEVSQWSSSYPLYGEPELYNESDTALEDSTAYSIIHVEGDTSDLNITLASTSLSSESSFNPSFYTSNQEVFGVDTDDEYCPLPVSEAEEEEGADEELLAEEEDDNLTTIEATASDETENTEIGDTGEAPDEIENPDIPGDADNGADSSNGSSAGGCSLKANPSKSNSINMICFAMLLGIPLLRKSIGS